MREAIHVNDQKKYNIPQNLPDEEIQNLKLIANKGTFKCPYCNAKLYVKSGPIHGNYFSHQHGEGCELSKQSEARSRKYEQQKKNDTPRHPQILAQMYDELHVLSKVYSHLTCSLGYLDAIFLKYIPDISLQIHDHKYALTIITNVNSSLDDSKANTIRKHTEYYKTLGYEPLFFIERSNLGIDTDGYSLVLWQTEKEALTVQAADLHWQQFLTHLAPASQLQQLLYIPKTPMQVQSILYITPATESIAIEAFHVIEYPNSNPAKAYFFSQPYPLTFSQAFKLTKDSLILANMELEQENQQKFANKFKEALTIHLKEQERIEQEKALQLQKKLTEEAAARERKKQIVEQNTKTYDEQFKNSAYQKAAKETRMEMLKRVYNSNN
ncbi:MAG: competence protein CoiA family protein [Solibacillus sp.]